MQVFPRCPHGVTFVAWYAANRPPPFPDNDARWGTTGTTRDLLRFWKPQCCCCRPLVPDGERPASRTRECFREHPDRRPKTCIGCIDAKDVQDPETGSWSPRRVRKLRKQIAPMHLFACDHLLTLSLSSLTHTQTRAHTHTHAPECAHAGECAHSARLISESHRFLQQVALSYYRNACSPVYVSS